MGFIPGQGFAAKAKALLKPGQGGLGIRGGRIRTKNPDETCLDEFAEGGLPLCCGDFGSMEEIVRKIDRGLHEQ
jgi:hypothetical protein